jgi:hypothetical protein
MARTMNPIAKLNVCRLGVVLTMITGMLGITSASAEKVQSHETEIGGGWSLSEDRFSNGEHSCLASIETENTLFKFVIGSRGGFFIAIADVPLINQLSSVGLWTPGAEYRAQIFIGKEAPYATEGHQYGDHTVMIRVPYSSVPKFSRADRVAINLNGLAMRGFKVPGMKRGLNAVIACAKKNSLIVR